MPENKPDSAAITPPPRKTYKERTMGIGHISNLSQIDVTQPFSLEEMALIARANEEKARTDTTATPSGTTAPGTSTNLETNPKTGATLGTTAATGPRPKNIAEKKTEDTKKEAGFITSVVGKYTSNDKEKANLAQDVILVQEHLVRLEMLGEEDFAAEKPTGTGEISKDKIPKTIQAIWEFQENVMGYAPDGFCRPGKGTIKNMVSLKLEDKAAKMAEVQKKKEARAAEEAKKKAEEEKQKALAAREAKAKAEAEKKGAKAKLKRTARIVQVQHTDTSYINVLMLTRFMSFSELGEFLKDYALYNPKFARRAYQIHTDYKTSDNLTRAILRNMSDSEITMIPDDLKDYLYDTIKWGIVTEEERDLMAKLKKGKALEEEKEKEKEFKTVEPIISTDDFRSQSTKAPKGVKDSEPGGKNCKLVAEKMVYRHLYEKLDKDFKQSDVTNDNTGEYEFIVGNVGNNEYLSILHEDKSEYKNIKEGKPKQSTFLDVDTKNKALTYLNEYLDQGIAVVVGVDHTFNRSLKKSDGKTTSKNTRGYNEGTTDHFIVIVGKGITEDGKKYYQFYDPGTANKSKATKTENKLIENENGQFVGDQPYSKKTYHLTMVILFKKDLKGYSEEMKSNVAYKSQLDKDLKNKTGDFKK